MITGEVIEAGTQAMKTAEKGTEALKYKEVRWILVGGAIIILFPFIRKYLVNAIALPPVNEGGKPSQLPQDAQIWRKIYKQSTLNITLPYWAKLGYKIIYIRTTRKGSWYKADPIAVAWWSPSKRGYVWIENITYI